MVAEGGVWLQSCPLSVFTFPILADTNKLCEKAKVLFPFQSMWQLFEICGQHLWGQFGVCVCVNICTCIHQMDAVMWTFPVGKTNKTAWVPEGRRKHIISMGKHTAAAVGGWIGRCGPADETRSRLIVQGWTCELHLWPLTIATHLQVTALSPQRPTTMGL